MGIIAYTKVIITGEKVVKIEAVIRDAIVAEPKASKGNDDFTENRRNIVKPGKG